MSVTHPFTKSLFAFVVSFFSARGGKARRDVKRQTFWRDSEHSISGNLFGPRGEMRGNPLRGGLWWSG
jgi:hypothetical protein